MKYIILAILIVTSAYAAELKTKSELLDAIVKAQGLLELAEKIKTSNLEEAKEAMTRSYDELAARMPDIPKQVLDQIQTAGEKSLRAMDAAWSPKESLVVWKEAYAVDFTEDDLKQILAYIESPLGQKELAASKRAVNTWRSFILQKNKESGEIAMKEYGDAVARIFAENKKTK